MIFFGVFNAETESAIELFVARKDAESFLAECLADEPDWRDVLSERKIEFEASPN